jgi:hypothetical protein
MVQIEMRSCLVIRVLDILYSGASVVPAGCSVEQAAAPAAYELGWR